MKVRILKHCKIHGAPATPGEEHDVDELRAQALTDNGYAEAAPVADSIDSGKDQDQATGDDTGIAGETDIEPAADQGEASETPVVENAADPDEPEKARSAK